MRTHRIIWTMAALGAAACAGPATAPGGEHADHARQHGDHAKHHAAHSQEHAEYVKQHGAHLAHLAHGGHASALGAALGRLVQVQDPGAGRPRVMIGVSMGPVSEALAAQLGVDPSRVVMITDLTEGMPAQAAGLLRFDIITGVDGESPVTDEVLRARVLAKAPDEAVRLRILRAGQEREIVVRVRAVEDVVVEGGEDGDAPRARVRVAPPDAPAPPRAPRAPQAQAEREIARALREHARAEGDRARAIWQEFGDEQRQAMAQLMDELRGLEVELNPEAREAIKRAMEEVQRAMRQGMDFEFRMGDAAPEIEFFPNQGDDGVVILQEPQPAPGAPGQWSRRTPGPGALFERNPALDERLNGLEERLTRLEEMLERLLEREDRR